MRHAIAVDIGGTFTDLVAYDRNARKVAYTKSPTTYENFADAIFNCFQKTGISPADASILNHGTTLVINALLQRRGAKTALVTTSGFRDILEIARGNRPDPFDLHYSRHEPLVPRELRFEVSERIAADGSVVTPLDKNTLADLAKVLKAENIEAVAIFFMNSYANATHEEEAAAYLAAHLPGVYVTHSTSLTRQWYEYERTSTVAANAYVGPQVDVYIRCLQQDLEKGGFGGSLLMMGSNGGLLSADHTCEQPIALVESGPIGGCIGAGAYAEALGFKNVIAFDMGGTTAKCALIEEGCFSVESTYYVGGYAKGFPIQSPVIDIVEVGAGGGSIAWIDSQKRLHVGPQSAGSTPGPVCYGRGGDKPTVTDANLILGRLNPANFLGGDLALDVEGARKSIGHLADTLGYQGADGLLRMAEGILAISTVVMGGAIKQVSVEHGLDPRDFALFCYGGGGPLHGVSLARELSIPMVIIPPEPGNFSAIGMLLADARIDRSTTFTGLLIEETLARARHVFADLETDARRALERDFAAQQIFFQHHAEMRYSGQRHNIKVPIANLSDLDAVSTAFHHDYKRRYGHADVGAKIEIQALHLAAFARQNRPDLSGLPRACAPMTEPTERLIHFGEAGLVRSKVYLRDSLPVGFSASGPAVIEEYGSTSLVWPNDRFEIGPLREIRIFLGEG